MSEERIFESRGGGGVSSGPVFEPVGEMPAVQSTVFARFLVSEDSSALLWGMGLLMVVASGFVAVISAFQWLDIVGLWGSSPGGFYVGPPPWVAAFFGVGCAFVVVYFAFKSHASWWWALVMVVGAIPLSWALIFLPFGSVAFLNWVFMGSLENVGYVGFAAISTVLCLTGLKLVPGRVRGIVCGVCSVVIMLGSMLGLLWGGLPSHTVGGGLFFALAGFGPWVVRVEYSSKGSVPKRYGAGIFLIVVSLSIMLLEIEFNFF